MIFTLSSYDFNHVSWFHFIYKTMHFKIKQEGQELLIFGDNPNDWLTAQQTWTLRSGSQMHWPLRNWLITLLEDDQFSKNWGTPQSLRSAFCLVLERPRRNWAESPECIQGTPQKQPPSSQLTWFTWPHPSPCSVWKDWKTFWFNKYS